MESKTHTILLVDDNPENLNVLSKILENNGYKVRTAKNGQLALNSILAAPPDLALVDIHMPVMDGYALCEKMKCNSAISDIPVLFVSAMGESFNKMIAFELGAVDYLIKPVEEKEVLARVKAHLEIRDLQRSLKEQNAFLEEKVEERTRELQESLKKQEALHQQLECLSEAKNEFLRLISHELRTPLIGLGIVDELIQGRELSDEESKEYQNIFWSSHQKLINIVDHATTLTRLHLTDPNYELKQFSLKQLIEEASQKLKPLMETNSVSLKIGPDDSQQFVCDKTYIIMVFNALLETAIKFTHPNESVEVNWEKLSDLTVINFVSTGWTIEDKFIDQFFEILEIKEPIFPGGELGLSPAVAKQILSVCGGTVNVQNKEDQSGVILKVQIPHK